MVSRRAHWHILYGRPSKAIGIDASAVCVRKGFGSAGRRRDRRPASPALQPSYRDVEDLLIERGGHPPARRNCGRLRTTRRSCAAGRSTRILERRSDTRGNGVPHRLPATGRHVAIVSNNSADAIHACLRRTDLGHLVDHVEGRSIVEKMKPDPGHSSRPPKPCPHHCPGASSSATPHGTSMPLIRSMSPRSGTPTSQHERTVPVPVPVAELTP
jgi:hypothetical protein